jgi:hypothetical protein
VTSTETERTDGQSGGNAAAEQENGNGDSGARKALKIGALAAAAGTAAYAASRAMTSSGSQGDDDEGSENGGGGRGGRTTMDQIASAIGNSRWDMLRDMVVPFAESGARSAGAYVAKDTPDFLSDTLVPKFIEGFVEAKGKKVTGSD